MSSAKPESACPFCHAGLAPKASVCPSCRAQKQTRKGMSPLGFKVFAFVWLGCSVAMAVVALYLALLPWLPEREAPPYALRLVGAAPAKQARCTVEVIDPQAPGSARQVVPCAPADAAATGAPVAQPQATDRPTHRRLAATLHGALVLSLAATLSWLLRRALRALFLRPTGAHWVRRTV